MEEKKLSKYSKVGRPGKFASVEDFTERAEAYLLDCQEQDEPLTITGLALALGTTRETLMDYQNNKDYSDTVKKYKQIIAREYEKRLIKRGNSGDIFALKNFGWKDTSEVIQTNNNGPDLSSLTVEEIKKMLGK